MKTFRNRSYLYMGWGLILIGAALVLVPVALEPVMAGAIITGMILTWPFGLAFVLLGWFFCVRPRLVADSAGVTIVNRGKTIRLQWTEIERFDARGSLLVYRKGDEKPVVVWAVQAANITRMLGRRSHADNVAADLNAMLATATGATAQSLSVEKEASRGQMRWGALVLAALALVALAIFLLNR